MKKRILSLALALVMMLGVLPVGAGASNFDDKYSEVVSGSISQKGETDVYTFTVPCDGEVYVQGRMEHSKYTTVASQAYKIKIYRGDTVYFENYPATGTYHDEDYLFRGYKKIASLRLPAGTYSVSVGDPGWSGFYTIIPEITYYISWEFRCIHKSLTEEERIDPTCSEEGKIKYICDDCGVSPKTETISKLPHTPDGEWVTVKEPTCSEEGLRTQTCTVCGETAEEEKLDRLEHTYGKWKVVREGTCQKAGERMRTCSVCGYEDKQTTSTSDDHDFGDWDVTRDATCTETGLQRRKCLICGKEETETIPKAKHEYGDWITEREATCGKAGEEIRKCRNCGETESRKIPATGKHTFGEWKQENESRFHRDCTVCGYTENRYVEPTAEIEPEGSERIIIQRAGRPNPENLYLKPISFDDVSASAWYQSVVAYAYNLGLMVGISETTFNPTGNMTLAEAITMAARARNSYKGGTNEDFKASKVWYQTYVDYALEQGILKQGDFDNYERPATRAEMAYLFANALPAEGMKAINTVEKLPDVKESDHYGKEIFTLYRAGVLTGQDEQGTFAPESPITRAEAAAIITRVTLSSERKSLELK